MKDSLIKFIKRSFENTTFSRKSHFIFVLAWFFRKIFLTAKRFWTSSLFLARCGSNFDWTNFNGKQDRLKVVLKFYRYPRKTIFVREGENELDRFNSVYQGFTEDLTLVQYDYCWVTFGYFWCEHYSGGQLWQ